MGRIDGCTGAQELFCFYPLVKIFQNKLPYLSSTFRSCNCIWNIIYGTRQAYRVDNANIYEVLTTNIHLFVAFVILLIIE